MRLKLSTSSSAEGINLYLPVTPAEVSEAFARFERIGVEPSRVRIVEASEHLPCIGLYAWKTDIHNAGEFQKLNDLAKAIDQMDAEQYDIFAGALKAENINSLDDIIHISEHLDNYVLLPHIKNDTDLCQHLLDIGFKECPEDMRAYLDFEAVGRDFRMEYGGSYGGAYGNGGYVRRKNSLEQERRNALITLHLVTKQAKCHLVLPAEEEELDHAKERLGIEYFTEATITKVEFGKPYLADLIPQECICVEDANELALGIEEMQQKDGELLKFLAVLSVEQPETMSDALRFAINLDDYERITEDTYEYGQTVLRRHGADDELLEAMDGYMDFEKLGEDAMAEDGVRQTEFGLIRRCSAPFS